MRLAGSCFVNGVGTRLERIRLIGRQCIGTILITVQEVRQRVAVKIIGHPVKETASIKPRWNVPLVGDECHRYEYKVARGKC